MKYCSRLVFMSTTPKSSFVGVFNGVFNGMRQFDVLLIFLHPILPFFINKKLEIHINNTFLNFLSRKIMCNTVHTSHMEPAGLLLPLNSPFCGA